MNNPEANQNEFKQPQNEIQKKHPIFKQSTSPRFKMSGTSPLFQNLEYNHMTRDLQEKYGSGLKFKNELKENDIGVSEALNILVTMIVCGAALGFIGYGYGGPIYAGLGGAIGIFIGMIVDTLLVIIYSNKLSKAKPHPKTRTTPTVVSSDPSQHKKVD